MRIAVDLSNPSTTLLTVCGCVACPLLYTTQPCGIAPVQSAKWALGSKFAPDALLNDAFSSFSCVAAAC